jgi:3-oxoacyl-[acyl-carrier-protein] synthase II
MPRSVVITGLGATTPLGGDVASTWEAMLAGRSGVVALTEERYANLPARIAAPVAVQPEDALPKHELRRFDRSEALAMIAAREAWAHAGYGPVADEEVDPERLVVSVATGIGGMITLITSYDRLMAEGSRSVSPYNIPMIMPNGAAGWLGVEFKARRAVHAPVSACASGNEAIARGFDYVSAGEADVAVVGGCEAVIHQLPLASFAAMRALSMRNDDPQRASRPFDSGRDGFVLGEGAGILILESEEHATARGATIHGRVLGSGISADGHHIAQPDPGANGATAAMRRALEAAGAEPRQVVHINAHATATPAGDTAEGLAIHKVLGDEQAERVVVTAPKSTMGHLLGAAGAVESIQTVLTLKHGKVPPTINLDNQDPDVHLDIATTVRDLPEADGPAVALNNSFGFGGHNVAVAFGRPDGS